MDSWLVCVCVCACFWHLQDYSCELYWSKFQSQCTVSIHRGNSCWLVMLFPSVPFLVLFFGLHLRPYKAWSKRKIGRRDATNATNGNSARRNFGQNHHCCLELRDHFILFDEKGVIILDSKRPEPVRQVQMPDAFLATVKQWMASRQENPWHGFQWKHWETQ